MIILDKVILEWINFIYLNSTIDDSNANIRVYLDGCFDLMHAGHYNSFRQAKKFGKTLVAGINSDEEVSVVKGPTVFNGVERGAIVGAWKWVDEVVLDTIYTPTVELIDSLNCAFLTHGDDIAINSDGVDATGKLREVGRLKIF